MTRETEIAGTQKLTDKVAYATFYSSRTRDSHEEDPYFDAVRLLIYQLLYQSGTRTRLNIPVLVFVIPHVAEERRFAFRELGAEVIELDYVSTHGWVHPRHPRWEDQLCKLRIFQQVSYDRILYLDSDMLIIKCLDGIWDEPVAKQWCKTLPLSKVDPTTRALPLGSPPGQYLFVGISDTYGSRKPDPPIPWYPELINGGFWLAAPSIEMFEYYISFLAVQDSCDAQYMEQGIFREAHRDGGAMPWTRFDSPKWNVNWPRVEDLYRGTATLHDRFWITDEPWVEEELNALWVARLHEMSRFLEDRAGKETVNGRPA